MNSKQRVLLALSHKTPDRCPMSLGFGINSYALEQLRIKLGLKDTTAVSEYVNSFSDIRKVRPDYVGDNGRNVTFADGSQLDYWGVTRKAISYGHGNYLEISNYPLANIESIKELNQYQFPRPDWFDYNSIKKSIDAYNSNGNIYAIQTGTINVFEAAWYTRGFETMLMDLLAEPELAFAIMQKVTDFWVEYLDRLLTAGAGMIDIVHTADDIGQQDGLLMKLSTWEELIAPHHKRINEVIHRHNAKVMYHTDGAVMQAVGKLVDGGIDILEALQFDAKNMDADNLKRDYGDRLCFHGGISVQSTLPYGTPEEVHTEVKKRIEVLGQNGGYIAAPSHAIQDGTPPENIIAFLEATKI